MNNFPYNDLEKKLYENAIKNGIDEGHAACVARALRNLNISDAIWEIMNGIEVTMTNALTYIDSTLKDIPDVVCDFREKIYPESKQS